MFCQRCGGQLPENTSKCPHCGAEYKAENIAENITASMIDYEQAPKKRFFTKKKIIITAIIAVILIEGGIAAVFTLQNGYSISISTVDMLQLADKYLKEMNYEQAIIEFQKVLEIEPKNVEAYIGLADAYIALGDDNKAIEVLEEARRNIENEQRIENKIKEIRTAVENNDNISDTTTYVPQTTVSTTKAATTTPETLETSTTAIITSDDETDTTISETTEDVTETVIDTEEAITTINSTATVATEKSVVQTSEPVSNPTTTTETTTTTVATTTIAAAATTTATPATVGSTIIVPPSESSSFNVPGIIQNALTIDPITQATAIAENADIISYTGSITYVNQEDVYTYTPPRDGYYRFEFSEIMSGNSVNIYVYNDLGESVKYNTSCGNGTGVTVDMTTGETYKIVVYHNSGFSDYTLLIGQQKPTLDISNLTSLTDSIEFTHQENIYSFTPIRDGFYRFEFSGIMSGKSVNIYVYNGLGESVKYNTSCGNGTGVTVDMTMGETYKIVVYYNSGFSDYTLLIGQQKPTVDISNLTSLTDSIEFTHQENIYSFTPIRDGYYRFEFSEIMSGNSVNIYVYNDLGESVKYNTSCGNGTGVTVDMTMGETYKIVVYYNSGFSDYTLLIGQQKPTVDISNLTSLTDSIEFTHQENIYSFTPIRDGFYRFEFSGIMSGKSVNIYVYNGLGESVKYNTSCGNGTGVTVDMTTGKKYKIVVYYNSGFSDYTFLIGT
ncbi:MAG: tetratricopeptide repeat protein [Eubacterium sp.]|nr:tetratricopeptide repeat protein [Eubacterium sp.]